METVIKDGVKTSKVCRCELAEKQKRIFAKIPREFGVPRLSEIKADPRRHPDQAKKIEFLRANPDISYFLYGSNGSGKSFLGWALYVHAVEQGRVAVACELETLLDQYRAFEFSQKDEIKHYPLVMAQDLRKSKTKYTIFLDEICATSPTEYASKEFLSLLKAAHEGGHQMIFTVNKTPEGVHEFWSRKDADLGNSIARRIADYSQQVNLFRS